MGFYELLPILIPTMLMQVGIEAYYIKHCWDNKNLTQRQKVLFIILIAVFNITAAAVYLFYSRSDRNEQYNQGNIKTLHIDSGTRQGIFVLLIISFEMFTFNLVYENYQIPRFSLLIALIAICFVSMIVNGLFIKPQNKVLYYIFPVIAIILALVVNYMDVSGSSQFILLVVLASIINGFNLRDANIYALATLGLYLVSDSFKLVSSMEIFNSDDLVRSICVKLLTYLLVYLAFYTLKKQTIQNSLLNDTYRKLKEQSQQLEKMSALNERNRLAGEIHDNVGHNLTTAIISIEAGEKLIETGGKGALKKLKVAREQVKDALQKIRLSVRTIADGQSNGDFTSKLSLLVNQIMKNTPLKINALVDLETELLPIQQSIILQAINECSTNSIKHGNSTQIDLLVQEHVGMLHFTFSDNGAGVESIEYGFGLSNMEQRIMGIGGAMRTESAPGEGFSLSIVIPIGDKPEEVME